MCKIACTTSYLYLCIFIIFNFLTWDCLSLYSSTYRKCLLFGTKAKNICQLKQQKVPIIDEDYYIQPVVNTRKPLQYTHMDYFYNQYIGAGGSGEVFLVQDLQKHQQKIFKRFFKQKKFQFQQENFIMHKLNYSVQWTRDYQILENIQGSIQDSDESQKQQKPKENINMNRRQDQRHMTYNEYVGYMTANQPTIAIYPAKESFALKELQFDPDQAKLIFYKLVRQLKKTHSNGIIHNDLKMGNILINSIGSNFKLFQTQLIDWNLASFYYQGYQSNMKKGTVCYYSPQLLFRTYHITPAIDVWSLGVVLFIYFTDRKPFFFKCKQDNLRAIVSLVGGKKILQLIQKYKYNYLAANMELLNQIRQNPDNFPARSIRDAIPLQRKQFFTDQLVEIFQKMLIPDPQERITISELLVSKYFQSLRKLPMIGYMKKMQQQKKNKKVQPQPQIEVKSQIQAKVKVQEYQKSQKEQKNTQKISQNRQKISENQQIQKHEQAKLLQQSKQQIEHVKEEKSMRKTDDKIKKQINNKVQIQDHMQKQQQKLVQTNTKTQKFIEEQSGPKIKVLTEINQNQKYKSTNI